MYLVPRWIKIKESIPYGYFLLFVKPIKVFDEKYFEFNSQNKEIVLFWTTF